jgi:L-iditol 2-dehydrogenase
VWRLPNRHQKIQFGTVPPPRVFGHETAGTIVKIGARITGFRVGDRVALHHHVPCLECHECRHQAFAQCAQKRTGITAGFEPAGGGYAEYVRVMSFVLPGVVKIPRANTLIEGAMIEPVNTVLKAVNRLKLLTGDVVLVAGQGPIGLMFTRLLALRGMKVFATDLMQPRLKLARRLGAHWAFNPAANGAAGLLEAAQRAIRARGCDAVVVTVPLDEVVEQALTSCAVRAKCCCLLTRGAESRAPSISLESAWTRRILSAAIPRISSFSMMWLNSYSRASWMCESW